MYPKNLISAFFIFALLIACQNSGEKTLNASKQSKAEVQHPPLKVPDNLKNYSKAIFAGGCFWCTEAVFERVKGVKQVISGYAGGDEINPTYKEVSAGKTGHTESILIYYDAEVVNYKTLLKVFFASHDPTQLNRQGPDVGEQYRSAVFYMNQEQEKLVRSYVVELNQSGEYSKEIVTQIEAFTAFYSAEDYHQDYYEHNPQNPYIKQVTEPKVKKFLKQFSDLLKEKYRSS